MWCAAVKDKLDNWETIRDNLLENATNEAKTLKETVCTGSLHVSYLNEMNLYDCSTDASP